MVNEVKSFAYTVNSQLFIHTLAKLLILYGLWGPFLCPVLPFDVHPVPWPNFVLAVLSQRTFQLLSLFPFLFLRQAPATFTFSSVFLLLLLFLSCLRLVTKKLVSCQGKTSWKMSAALPPPVVLGPLLNEGMEAEERKGFA